MKKNKSFLIFIVIFFITAIFINPAKYIESIISGAKLFFYNVFPTLLPFVFFTNLLSTTPFSYYISKILYKPINKIYHTSYYSAYIFIMSFFVGYPISTKLISDLANDNKIYSNEILAISSFTSNCNPLFIIATIGVLFLKNTYFALIILVSHYTSSLLNGIIHSTLKLKKQPVVTYDLIKIEDNNIVKNTAWSIITVFIYVCIFNLIIDIVIDYNILYYITYPFNFIFTKLKFPENYLYYNLLSKIEVTNGIYKLCNMNIKNIYLLPLIASSVSFGGLSINLQCHSFIKDKIKFSSFLYTKITQAIFAYVICFILCIILKIY